MARPPADDSFTELVTASWPSLYRTAYLQPPGLVRYSGLTYES